MPENTSAVAPMSPPIVSAEDDGSFTNQTTLFIRNGCVNAKAMQQARGRVGATAGSLTVLKHALKRQRGEDLSASFCQYCITSSLIFKLTTTPDVLKATTKIAGSEVRVQFIQVFRSQSRAKADEQCRIQPQKQ